MEDIVKAAIAWFSTKRPLEFTLEEHLDNPRINTVTDAEKLLGYAVGEYLRKQLESGKL